MKPLTGDNQFLKIGVELGIAGLAVFLVLLFSLGFAGFQLSRRNLARPARLLGIVVLTATVGIALNGLTVVLLSSMQLSYLYFWLAGSAVTVLTRTEALPLGDGAVAT
jgi:O-antigen ligase